MTIHVENAVRDQLFEEFFAKTCEHMCKKGKRNAQDLKEVIKLAFDIGWHLRGVEYQNKIIELTDEIREIRQGLQN